ncbi:DUF4199 domain-containing protein [Aequorivita viscosa]|uniref:DUF4199 domain-containing protein n=1 Tax=Aequorivita viscosa TaxID=797419 RepID=A0A1M6I7D0_9FLAO|nr:DUF4199 domain-containing protein [Aequorivita viscosa]SDW99626.1 Protein of unknown function [Aequorivita viscosa]SHJ30306.1 Protein of unknown function [Aequorivita viscosa]
MLKIYSTYGIGIAIVLIAYFLILKLIGLHHYPVLSVVNALFFGAGIYFALKSYQSKVSEVKYEKGFEAGLFTGGIASIIFTVFMALYMYQIDGVFATSIMESWNMETQMGTAMIVVSVFIMGLVTTLILTFSLMQLFKKSWNAKNRNRNTL